MRILISGATGLIGKKLVNRLIDENHVIFVLTRSKENALKTFDKRVNIIETDYKSVTTEIKDSFPLNGIINLSGENIAAKRWSNSFKKKIYSSRIDTTSYLVKIANSVNSMVKFFINASAIGFYGYSDNTTFDESSEKGQGFLPDLVHDWENQLNNIEDENVRKVFIRIGVVLAKEGGALQKMAAPFKMYVGGPVGKGSQYLSWIHENDLVNIFYEVIKRDKYTGAINAVAPNPVDMDKFSLVLAKKLNKPFLFRVPGFIIKLIMGEGAQIVLEGTKVSPDVLTKNHFEFNYPDINSALDNLL